ncbi:SDR family oxidoreductase [Kribbella sp. NPDC023972]|uniref:SDR family oxidoreductase n=1 Tax=Kribbella sp. NPDC023972 TaxID=3154795 RepID=UPI0033C172A6
MNVAITGGSRGLGAEVARNLSRTGHAVAISYKSRRRRADRVLRECGGADSFTVQADLAADSGPDRFAEALQARWRHVDALVLCASAGLEPHLSADAVRRINHLGQLRLVELVTALMRPGGRVVYVTSHPAHLWGEFHCPAGYRLVAETKRRCEDDLRARSGELERRGLRLTVLSADLFTDSPVAAVLDDFNPGLADQRATLNGSALTTQQVAAVVCDVLAGRRPAHGGTVIVGSTRSCPSPSTSTETTRSDCEY